MTEPSQDWKDDCLRWRGKVLTGKHGHWCPDWDYLPIDETTPEWPCPCSASDDWRTAAVHRLDAMAGVDVGGIIPPTPEDLARGIDRTPSKWWKGVAS